MDESDLLVITSDHGNDPTLKSTDHSREFVPLLIYGRDLYPKDLGERESFSDVAQTVCHFFKVNNALAGKSCLE